MTHPVTAAGSMDLAPIVVIPSFDVVRVTGPFFLGFALEYFGMGVLLMLGIYYFGIPCSQTSASRGRSRRNDVFVMVSLGFNGLQTTVDIYRGWKIFAYSFLDIRAFADPDVFWFISPFFGLFPVIITQLFLLQRIVLFLTSLSSLWPMLQRPLTIYGGVIVMLIAILVAAVAGSIGCYYIWRGGAAWHFLIDRHSLAHISDLVWLSTSSAVDVILSALLTFELWWARRKMAATQGLASRVMIQVMLVTFHGGLAVTILQLIALILFRYQPYAAWCYLTIIFLPKVYTITLILSLTLPKSHAERASPSQAFSLPVMINHSHISDGGRVSQPATRPPSSSSRHRQAASAPQLALPFASDVKNDVSRLAKRHSGFSAVFKRSWRGSHDWKALNVAISPAQGDKDWPSNVARDQRVALATQYGSEGMHADYRRPSEPDSLAPLVSPTEEQSDILHARQFSRPYTQPYRLVTDYTTVGISLPALTLTVARQNSFSGPSWEDERVSDRNKHGLQLPSMSSPESRPSLFGSISPFTTISRGDGEPIYRNRSAELWSRSDAARIAQPRKLSFQDMLAGPDIQEGGATTGSIR